MGQILAIVSSKGGVGKTTTAVNLAAAFASLDFPTLLIEADPQCGLVANFGYDRFDIPRGLADVARGECEIEETTFETPVPGLHVISSNVWTQEEEALYLGALERDPLVLARAFRKLTDGYDYLMIDAPPMLGPITMAILAAADRFLVPVQAEPQSVRILSRLMETSVAVRDRFNPKLRFDGIALTMVDGRTRMSQQLEENVRAEWPDQVFRATVPRSIRLAEVHSSGRPLVLAAPASRGARAYAALAEEILLGHARERAMARAMDGADDGADEMPDDDLAAGLEALASLGSVALDDPALDEPADAGDLAGLAEAADFDDEPDGDGDDHAGGNRMAGFLAALAGGAAPGNGNGGAGGSPRGDTSRGENARTATPAGGETPDLAVLGLPAEDEWDERFVDLETYLEIESGGAAKAAVADEDWDEDEWSNWDRDDA